MSDATAQPALHLDLLKNDWSTDTQASVARVFLHPDGFGLIVKDVAGERWEGNIYDAVGPAVRGTADEILEILHQSFNGPYLYVTELHDDAECPFHSGPVQLERRKVDGEFVLPKLP